ncbi:MAG: hypothetical protein ACFFAN_03800 [Promethearchaeota archaeon]
MRGRKKINELKIILILIFISSYFLVSFFYVLLKDIPDAFYILMDHFASGNSLFIPSVPYFNVLWFLPQEHRVIQLTIGQLIDVFIILTLYSCVDTTLYHYVKKVLYYGNFQAFFNITSYDLSYKQNLSIEYQRTDKMIGVRNQIKHYLDDERIKRIKREKRKNERIESIFSNLRQKRRSRNKRVQSEIVRREIGGILCGNYRVNLLAYTFYSLFKKYGISSSKNSYPHFKVTCFSDFNEYLLREGKRKTMKFVITTFFKLHRYLLKNNFNLYFLKKNGGFKNKFQKFFV